MSCIILNRSQEREFKRFSVGVPIMGAWAERLLYLGLALLVCGVILRLGGYHQGSGFLQEVGMIQTGVTPRAFLMAGATCGIFSIA